MRRERVGATHALTRRAELTTVADYAAYRAFIGAAGLSISRVSPGAITEPSAHRTYNTALRGDYIGGSGQSVPKEIMYPDIVASYAQQGYPRHGFNYLMSTGRPPVFQRADQQWLDNLMKYIQEPK